MTGPPALDGDENPWRDEVRCLSGQSSKRRAPKVVPQSLVGKVKDVALFVGGFTGMALEVAKVFSEEPRTILVGCYLLMLGLPVFTGIDRLFQRPAGNVTPEPPTPEEPTQ